jgi:hypothetical protein
MELGKAIQGTQRRPNPRQAIALTYEFTAMLIDTLTDKPLILLNGRWKTPKLHREWGSFFRKNQTTFGVQVFGFGGSDRLGRGR